MTRLSENRKLQVGIVGLGAIGSFLIENLAGEKHVQVTSGSDTDSQRREKIRQNYPDLFITDDYTNFPDDTDVIVEAAHQQVADDIARWAIEKGKTVIIASVGGLGTSVPCEGWLVRPGVIFSFPQGPLPALTL